MLEKYSLWNKRMLLAVLAAVLILEHTYLKMGRDLIGAEVLYIITFPMATSMFGTFAAVFPALPYSLSFVEDYNTSYFRFALIRGSRKNYSLKKVISVGMAGGIMMVLAFGIVFLTALLLGIPTTYDNMSEFYQNTLWYPFLTVWGGKLVLLLKLILAFLFGAVWSNVCLMISIIFLNRYVAFIGTFIIYQLLWQLLSVSKWNPVYLLRGDIGGYHSFFEPFLMQVVMVMILGILNWFGMTRRMRNG